MSSHKNYLDVKDDFRPITPDDFRVIKRYAFSDAEVFTNKPYYVVRAWMQMLVLHIERNEPCP